MKVVAYKSQHSPALGSRSPLPRTTIVPLFPGVISRKKGSAGLTQLLESLEEYVRSPAFASLLEVQDVFALSAVCRSFHRIFDRKYAQLVIRLGNLESRLRPFFWIGQAPYIRFSSHRR